MNAPEIRAALSEQLKRLDVLTRRDGSVDAAVLQLLQYHALMEIAAQLAELNEHALVLRGGVR